MTVLRTTNLTSYETFGLINKSLTLNPCEKASLINMTCDDDEPSYRRYLVVRNVTI